MSEIKGYFKNKATGVVYFFHIPKNIELKDDVMPYFEEVTIKEYNEYIKKTGGVNSVYDKLRDPKVQKR